MDAKLAELLAPWSEDELTAYTRDAENLLDTANGVEEVQAATDHAAYALGKALYSMGWSPEDSTVSAWWALAIKWAERRMA